MTPTTCACRRLPTALANSGSTSAIARSHRRGATATVQTATRDAPTPMQTARCWNPHRGPYKWADVDTYKVTYRKGDVIRACADFDGERRFPRGGHSCSIRDLRHHNWLFTTEAGIHCTDYFTVDRTGTYIINVIHFANINFRVTHSTETDQDSQA